MADVTNKRANWIRIEFWAITTLFAFAISFFIVDGLESARPPYESAPYKPFFDEVNIRFGYYKNYFIPQLIIHIAQFIFVLIMNFILIPKLLKREALLRNIFFTLLLFASVGTIYGITGTYLKGYLYAGSRDRDAINLAIFRDGFLNAWLTLGLLIIYTAIKYAGMYLLANSEKIKAKYSFIRKEALVAVAIWLIILFLLGISEHDSETMLAWAVMPPIAIALYLFSFHKLIPKALTQKHPFIFYIVRTLIILLLAYFPIFLILRIFIYQDEKVFEFTFFNSVFQLFITAPVSWALYKRHMKGNEELTNLKKELGKSNASIDFLRSQINPHFLFNALNTIYGTAIQEKAERTREGIERLGDMMRFMLQENMQEKISLTREIDYLNNYLALQKLRTDINPGITIQTEIDEHVNNLQIAPMLLIPFVENAFKHGISFREPSYIKVTLEVTDKTLNFDVSNSKHAKPENDPEKNKSGIGLENVRQRLQLLYPKKHELIIRETGKDFFVHLTIQLA